jgi:hypothetical protein
MPALGGGTPTTSHASTQFQFLGSVLSQRGPSALPYIEDDKLTIRQHLLHVIQEFPGLQVRLARAVRIQISGSDSSQSGFFFFIPLNCWKAWGGGMLFTLEEFLESGVYFCF